jgi:hypothetical protein
MKKSVLLTAACALSLGMATPSYANDALNSVASFFGSTAATIVDVPEGILWDALYRMPHKTQRTLADKFGDDKGFQQNVAATVIGLPVGFLWGIPEGAIRGGRHGMTSGWEKPFSTDSFLVMEKE